MITTEETSIATIAAKARAASRTLGILTTDKKNCALLAMAEALVKNTATIKTANAIDMAAGKESGLSSAMLDRLRLDDKRIDAMADGLRQVAALPDPVGEISDEQTRPNGLHISRKRIPIGVIGIIYESRPNVTADTAALCLKSGNAVVLRGGSEAINSNRAIATILRGAATAAGLPAEAIQLVQTTDREAVLELLRQEKNIDMIIPRGGYGLIRFVTENSLIPVVKHDKGVCHIYIDNEADNAMAMAIALNAKVNRPGVCNALETLLIQRGAAERLLPDLVAAYEKAGVELRGCAKSRAIAPTIKSATDDDWDEEYADLILSVKVVESFEEMAEHIARYSSEHTESIVTTNATTAERFLTEIDSSVVMVNASTRFNDGEQLGLGAEIGISTQKLHARGPMGLRELTIQKYLVRGAGQIRE